MKSAASSLRSAALCGLSHRLSLKSVKCRRCKNTAVCGACQQKTTIYCVLFAIGGSTFQTKGLRCGKRERPLRGAELGCRVCTKAGASLVLPHRLLSWFKVSPRRERGQEAGTVQIEGGAVQMWTMDRLPHPILSRRCQWASIFRLRARFCYLSCDLERCHEQVPKPIRHILFAFCADSNHPFSSNSDSDNRKWDRPRGDGQGEAGRRCG